MNEPILVPLEKIKANPYQPRAGDDPAAVIEIAVNIHKNGMLQVPSARAVNGHYELVFGHTRKAAYELLATLGVPAAEIQPDKKRWGKMPLYIHELDERQMFEMAVAESWGVKLDEEELMNVAREWDATIVAAETEEEDE